MLIYKGL